MKSGTYTGRQSLVYFVLKVENQSKSDCVINAGPIYVTGVAWHGCSRDWGARGLGFDSGENSPFFWGCQLKMR